MEKQANQAGVGDYRFILISREFLSSTTGPHSSIPEEILVMVQRNLIALHSFLEGNPHLFHSTTGDYSNARAAPATDQEAWKVGTFPFFCSTIDTL